MADELERRRSSKITRLPPEIREEVEDRLQDCMNSYQSIAEWLTEQGYEISSSAIYRHSLYMRKIARRIADMLEKTKYIAQVVEKSPDVDYTKASRIIAMDGLLQKVSSAEDEFLEMPIEKAVRLITDLSRTEIYDQKAKQDRKSKMELAFDSMAAELSEKIRSNPQLSAEFREVMEKARRSLFDAEE